VAVASAPATGQTPGLSLEPTVAAPERPSERPAAVPVITTPTVTVSPSDGGVQSQLNSLSSDIDVLRAALAALTDQIRS